MADVPDQLARPVHVDLAGRRSDVRVRRLGLLVVVAFVCLGLANVFGQRPEQRVAAGAAADLTVDAPAALRLGLVFQGSIRVDAREALRSPRLLLAPGWLNGVTVNSISPEPSEQAQRGDRLVLAYDDLAAGESLLVRIEAQVNPTALGRRDQSVAVAAEGVPDVVVDRRVTVYP